MGILDSDQAIALFALLDKTRDKVTRDPLFLIGMVQGFIDGARGSTGYLGNNAAEVTCRGYLEGYLGGREHRRGDQDDNEL